MVVCLDVGRYTMCVPGTLREGLGSSRTGIRGGSKHCVGSGDCTWVFSKNRMCPFKSLSLLSNPR